MQRPVRALGVDDLQHIFRRERFEIEPVGGVVIGRHRLRIAVDHDGLVAGLLEREGGVTAAVIELDALADAVRPAAEDDDFLLIRRRRLVDDRAGERCLVGRVHVGGRRGELGRAGVDALKHWPHAELAAFCHHRLGIATGQLGKALVGKAHGLEATEGAGRSRQAFRANFGFGFHQPADFRHEPGVDAAGAVDQLIARAEADRLRDLEQPIGCRRAERGADRGLVVGVVDAFCGVEAFDRHLVEAGEAGLERAQRFLQGFLEGAADRHRFADRLHRRGQHRRRAGEFLEGKARDFRDDIVDGRLERRRRGAAGDVVGDLVERVADRELGRDLGDRKAGRLGGQRRGARHPRVHLDHDHAAVGRIDAELHVGAAGLDPDLAQHRQRGVAHDLVFLVGQGQGRRHRDGIAGMHAHRIEVLDRADDDAIVLLVAHHLHLELFPAEHRFLDQHFVGRGGVEAAFDDVEELFLVVGDASAGAAMVKEGRMIAGSPISDSAISAWPSACSW